MGCDASNNNIMQMRRSEKPRLKNWHFRRVNQNHTQFSNISSHIHHPINSMVCKTLICDSPELISTLDGDENVPSHAGVKRQLPSRRVTFSEERNETHETYSRDEVQDSWYTLSDYEAIQLEIRSTSQMMCRGIPLDECYRSKRGLEDHDLSVFQASQEAQSIARTYVLEAQIQGKEAEEIGFYYAIHTRARGMKAYLQGIADERCGRVWGGL